MTESFIDFFAKHDVSGLTQQVYPSERFREKGLAFTIKVMSQEELNDYRKQSTTTNKRTGAQVQDPFRFNTLIVLNHVVDPDFRSVADIKSMGCTTAQQYLEKALLPGEIANLATAISDLSGFGEETQKAMTEEAKKLIEGGDPYALYSMECMVRWGGSRPDSSECSPQSGQPV